MRDDIKERIKMIKRGEMPKGYKKTKAGIIPRSWDVKYLSDIADTVGGGTPDTKNIGYWDGDIPWISSADLVMENTDVVNISRYITEEAIENSATKKCAKGTILIVSRVGVGKIALAPCQLCTSQDFTNLINVKGNTFFVLNAIKAGIKKKITTLQGTSIKGLTVAEIKNITLCYPTIEEQNKIEDIVIVINQKIHLVEQCIEEKRKQKKWFVQNYVTGKKRFGNFEKEWKTVQLERILDIRQDKNEDQNLHICSVAVQKGIINQIEHLGRSYAAEDTSNYSVVKYGDIVYTKSPTGDFPYGIIKQSKLVANVAVSPLYGVFKPKNYYLGYLIHSYFQYPKNVYKYLHPMVQKGAKNTINISNKSFLSGIINLPTDIMEQKKIALVLDMFDKEIELLEKQLEQIKLEKKAMMQLLLTGIVRVNEN